MQYAKQIKIVDHDGYVYQYENCLYWYDSAGIHIRQVTNWNMADIEHMEVNPGELEAVSGEDTKALDTDTDRTGVDELGQLQCARAAGAYADLFGRSAQGPADSEGGSDHGC